MCWEKRTKSVMGERGEEMKLKRAYLRLWMILGQWMKLKVRGQSGTRMWDEGEEYSMSNETRTKTRTLDKTK